MTFKNAPILIIVNYRIWVFEVEPKFEPRKCKIIFFSQFQSEKLNFYPKVIPNQRAAVFPAKKHYYDVECRVPPMQSPGLSLQTDPPGEDQAVSSL